MAILDAGGQPISTERSTTLEIIITDRQAGAVSAERSVMGFALDSDKPEDIGRLLMGIQQQVVKRLYDIGFLTPTSVVEAVGVAPRGADAEEGKGDE